MKLFKNLQLVRMYLFSQAQITAWCVCASQKTLGSTEY